MIILRNIAILSHFIWHRELTRWEETFYLQSLSQIFDICNILQDFWAFLHHCVFSNVGDICKPTTRLTEWVRAFSREQIWCKNQGCRFEDEWINCFWGWKWKRLLIISRKREREVEHWMSKALTFSASWSWSCWWTDFDELRMTTTMLMDYRNSSSLSSSCCCSARPRCSTEPPLQTTWTYLSFFTRFFWNYSVFAPVQHRTDTANINLSCCKWMLVQVLNIAIFSQKWPNTLIGRS